MTELAPVSDVVIVIDVLSFTTALDVAVSRRATVIPYPSKGPSAAELAARMNALLAAPRGTEGFSLSPPSLASLPVGSRLVLPSPNGSAISFAVRHPAVLAGCLRNATAVAAAAVQLGATFAVIPAGETWDSGELRPALEDLIAAGAIVSELPGARSPEAALAVAAFRQFAAGLPAALSGCGSGKELIARGFACDVDCAAQFNVSTAVPRLVNGAFAG